MLKAFKFYNVVILALLGPPTIRLNYRDAGATENGSLDGWVIFQTITLLFIGAYGLLYLLKNTSRFRKLFLAKAIAIPNISIATVSILLMISSFFTNNKVTSLTFSVLFSLMVFFGYAIQAKGYRSSSINEIEDKMEFCIRISSLILAVLVVILFVIAPDSVSSPSTTGTPRVLGGSIGATYIVGLNLTYCGCYLLIRKRLQRAAMLLFLIGILFVAISQTRGAYPGALALCFTLIFHIATDKRLGLAKTVILLSAPLLTLGAIFNIDAIIIAANRGATNDTVSQLTSGRSEIFSWVIDEVLNKPSGFGYITAFRENFKNLPSDYFDGIAIERIGNTHNSFLEIAYGAGIVAGIFFGLFYLSIFAKLAVFAKRSPRTTAPLALSLYLAYGSLMFTSADFSIAGSLEFACFIIVSSFFLVTIFARTRFASL